MRECPTCGAIYLNREGLDRRHFSTQRDGSVRLCRNFGHAAPSKAPEREAAGSREGDGRI